jgi:cytochrome c553
MIRQLPFVILALAMSCIAGAQEAPASASSAATRPVALLDVRAQPPIHGDAGAGAGKAAVCGACHGPQGIAIAPNFPHLAGQSATYIYLQLKAFKQGQRSDAVMTGQAAALSDQDMRDLAAHYAALPAKPVGQPDASSPGAQLFLAGDPAKGVPPCQGCHGPAGQGPAGAWRGAPDTPWHTFPRLGGQSAFYIGKELGDYRNGKRVGVSNGKVMEGVVQNLDDADIQALGAYIESL